MPLSRRQGQILRLVSEGLTTKEITDKLGISEGTVKHHKKKIFTKLGAANITQAAVQFERLKAA